MSEYQYYEFLAIDRPLDERQCTELRSLSSRAQITPASFVNEYHWGNFRGDPAAMMERYFDAFLYLANWGTRELMIRLPRDVLDLEVAQRYCFSDAAAAWATREHVILHLSSQQEDEYWEQGPEGWLSSIALARPDLASGDLRLLYLGWLLSVQAGEVDDASAEPPVPPNLRTLSPPLRDITDFLRIDADLLAAAATASADVRTAPDAAELTAWIEALPGTEKNSLLVQAARGGGALVQATLQRRFAAAHSPAAACPDAKARTAGDLRETAVAWREERKRRAVERKAEELARQAAAAAAARERRLDALALRQEQTWQQISGLIATTSPRRYDEAVALLKDLQALADRVGDGADFRRQLRQLREHNLRRPSLIQRLDTAGLQA